MFIFEIMSTATKTSHIGRKISRIRELRGMKQEALAAELGISQQSVSSLEQSEHIEDEKLAKFYKDLMVSEANHYTIFIGFARKYGGRINVDERWAEWLDFEGELIQSYGKKETIHG